MSHTNLPLDRELALSYTLAIRRRQPERPRTTVLDVGKPSNSEGVIADPLAGSIYQPRGFELPAAPWTPYRIVYSFVSMVGRFVQDESEEPRMRRKWMVGAALSAMLAAVIVVPVVAASGGHASKTKPLICAWNPMVTGSATSPGGIATVYVSIEQEDTSCSSGQVRAHAWTHATTSTCFSIKIEDWLYVNGVQAQYNYTPQPGGTIWAGTGTVGGVTCSSTINVYTNPYLAPHGASVYGLNKTTDLSSGVYQSATSPTYHLP